MSLILTDAGIVHQGALVEPAWGIANGGTRAKNESGGSELIR
jgi:hypothetical protein